MKPQEYIKWVNKQVKKGKHNRPIKIVYTKNKPTTEGKKGVATHINFKKYDRISLWRGLAKNEFEAKQKEKKYGRKVVTQDKVLRHELWHIIKPYISEKRVRNILEKRNPPKKLPTKRSIKNFYYKKKRLNKRIGLLNELE